MTTMTLRAGLSVDERLATFLETEVLTPLGRDVDAFWAGFAKLLGEFTPRNRELLAKREELQAKIDAYHTQRRGKPTCTNVTVDATIDTTTGTVSAIATMPASDLVALGVMSTFTDIQITVGARHLIES